MDIDEDLVIEEEEEIVEDSDVSEEVEPENDQDEDEDEDRVVTIGDSVSEDDEPEETEDKPETPGWVKKVRKVNRKLEGENKRLKRELEERSAEVVKPVELGEKPTLKSSGYDEDAYDAAVIAYHERKKKVEEQASRRTAEVEAQNKAYKTRQEKYVNLKQEHNFKDFLDAETLVSDTFSQVQQGIIVQGADDSALLVYALGKNPKKLEELSKITDPVEFAFKIAKLESQLKVTDRRAPKPEKRVSSGKSGGISGSADKTLERLRDEAAKTNDYTKIAAYKKKLHTKDK